MPDETPETKPDGSGAEKNDPAVPGSRGRGIAAEVMATLRASGQGVFARMNTLLSIVVAVACLVVLWVVIIQSVELAQVGKPYGQIYTLLMVAAAAFGLGTFAGFVFGAVGEEKEIFGGIATAVNGVIGGFALSDLTQSQNSVIIAVLHSLADSCGQQTVGLVSCLIGFYGSAGFMFMYMNKQYLLNPELSKKQQLAEQNQRLSALTLNVKVSLAEAGTLPTTDAKNLECISKVLKDFESARSIDPTLVNLLSLEALRSYSKAYYVAGEIPKAEAMLRQARMLQPDDVETLFFLSHLLITAKRPREAIPYLTFLQALPNAPVLTWKLLGYACLWDSSRLKEAEQASEKYLAFAPDDAGAKFNLACVHAQRGPQDPGNRQRLLTELRELVKRDPESGKLLVSFAKLDPSEDDFYAWRNDSEFNEIIAPFGPTGSAPKST